MVPESEFINLDNAPLQFFQLSTMLAAEKLALKKKLKSELAHVRTAAERLGAEGERGEFDPRTTFGKVKRKPEMNKPYKKLDGCSDDVATFVADKSKVKPAVPVSNKRGPPRRSEVKVGKKQKMDNCVIKKQKMDSCVMQQCSSILKKLMTHPAAWMFNQPVDPVALKIPDYFSIISKPMDLGTIKSKLEKKLYLCTQEFVADVRLTFSNAMLYNPPMNNVHVMAKKLNDIFNSRWKSLELKWSESLNVGQQPLPNEGQKKTRNVVQGCQKTPASHVNLLPKRMMSSADRQKLRKDLVEEYQKGTGNGDRLGCPSANVKPHRSPGACISGSCGSMTSQCNRHNELTHAPSSDIDSERSSGNACRDGPLDPGHLENDRANTRMSQSDPDSDGEKGAVSAVVEDNIQPSSASGEGWEDPLYNGQVSPSKALRAAILKSRFADTILKAKQKTLLNHGEKADPVKMQQEKEIMERRQREEKEMIEAKIKATKAASRMKTEAELKMQREKEREAARIALQKMQKSVEIDENLQILKDLEMLSKCDTVMGAFGGICHGKVLERLGLFMKDDYVEEEEIDMNGDVEEGEIDS